MVFVGEGPGAVEVKEGEPFVGQSGILLQHIVRRTTDEEYGKTNVVCCRPPGNREPTAKEVECCLPRLKLEIEEWEPEVIVALGKTAADVFTDSGLKISQRRGLWYQWNGIDVLATWHPAYVLRRPGEMNTLTADITRALKGRYNSPVMASPQIVMPRNLTELETELHEIEDGSWVVFDLETDQLQWHDSPTHEANRILMMGIACSNDRAIIINHDLIYGSGTLEDYPRRDNAYFLQQQMYCDTIEGDGKEILQEFFNSNFTFVAHNGKFDALFLKSIGIEVDVGFDTMLAHYVLEEQTGTHGLKRLATEYLGLPNYEDEIIQGFLRTRNDYYSKVPLSPLALYCGWDVCITWELSQILLKRMIEDGLLSSPFHSLIMRAQAALMQVEYDGMGVDVPYLKQWKERILDYLITLDEGMAFAVADAMRDMTDDQLLALIKRSEKTVKSVKKMLTGEMAFNPRSSYMMSFALYDIFGLPRPRARRIKPTSTSKDAITNIQERYPYLKKHAFLLQLEQYRKAHKIQRSYVKNLLDRVDLEGSVHPTFLLHGTEVGRLSARNPAVQTIPRPYENIFGAIIRSSIIARPGYVFVDADYSQAELRVAACLSNEPFLLEVYREGRDLHSEVSIAMYGPDFNREQRVMCKMFNFSYLYGGNEYSFAQDAGLPIDIARKFVADYNDTMPKLAEYKQAQLALAKSQGYVESIFGRRRRFPLITRENFEDVRKACVHMPIASASSDLTLLSLTRLVEERYRAVLTVHDSIVVEVPVDHAESMAEYIVEVMEGTASYVFPQVPWKVDADIVTRWSPFVVQVGEKNAKELGGNLPTVFSMEQLTGLYWVDELLTRYGKVQVWPMLVK